MTHDQTNNRATWAASMDRYTTRRVGYTSHRRRRFLISGEAQLFALTRVFLTEPSLVILDEPSSRLDAATESLLQSAIDELMKRSTGIIIAQISHAGRWIKLWFLVGAGCWNSDQERSLQTTILPLCKASGYGPRGGTGMNVTGFIGRLFRALSHFVNGLLWCIFHSLPLAMGLGMQWFFDRTATGSTELCVACRSAHCHCVVPLDTGRYFLCCFSCLGLLICTIFRPFCGRICWLALCAGRDGIFLHRRVKQ